MNKNKKSSLFQLIRAMLMNEQFFDIQHLKKSEGENVRDVLNENQLLNEQNLYSVEKKVKT